MASVRLTAVQLAVSASLMFALVASAICDTEIYSIESQESQAVREIGPNELCADVNAQQFVDIQQITGIWYGNELIEHLEENLPTTPSSAYDEQGRSRRRSRHQRPPMCIIVEIRDMMSTVRPMRYPVGHGEREGVGVREYTIHNQTEYTFWSTSSTTTTTTTTTTERMPENEHRHSQKMLSLIWDDSEHGMTEYRLLFNTTSRGTWHTEPTWINGYQSTKTDVQATFLVLKAVGDHMVLTQCQTEPTRKLQTITLSRSTDPMAESSITSVRKLVTQRRLPAVSRQRLCQFPRVRNSAGGDSSMVGRIHSVLMMMVMTSVTMLLLVVRD